MARGKFWINTILAAAVSAAVLPQFVHAQPAPAAAAPQVQQVVATLTDPQAAAEQRQRAARLLVSLHTPDSRSAVSNILSDPQVPQSQLAIARALADDPDPQPEFVAPLIALLGGSQSSPALGNAAAEALGIYKNDPNVVRQLSDIASGSDQTNRNLTNRVAAIRGLGLMCDKSAAATLMNLLTSPTEPQEIHNPAADALAALSGESIGRDEQGWQEWWVANRGKSDPKFRDDILSARAAKLDGLQRRDTDLEQDFKNFLDFEYQHAVAIERGAKPQSSADLLQSYLVSSNPVERVEAAELIALAKNQGNPVPEAARDQLRKMVDDSDPRVRLAVANAIYALNDHEALAPVLKQLDQESDPAVRAALVSILGQIGDSSAIPELRKRLDDLQIVAESAADALALLVPKLHDSNPPLARQIGIQLQRALARTDASDTGKFRGSIVSAMAALHDPNLEETFTNILNNPNESAGVRKYAVTGLGTLGDSKTADLLARVLNDDEDPDVRLATIDALKNVDGVSTAPQLVKMLQPGTNNPAIQAKAWETLSGFLPELASNQLQEFADDFGHYNDPAKRVTVLRAKFDKDIKDGTAEERGATQQNIGQSLMDDQLKEYDAAAAAFEAALTAYAGDPKTNKTTLNEVMHQKMQALLLAGKYDDAISFAGESIQKDKAQITEMGDLIEHEADRLRNVGQENGPSLDKALELIADTKQNVKVLELPQIYQDDLDKIEKDVRQIQVRNKGSSTIPPAGRNSTQSETARTPE